MSFFSSQPLGLRTTTPLTDKEFEELRSFIYQLAGIDVPKQRKYLLENRLRSRIIELKLKSFSEYYQYLRHGADRKQEIEVFCEKMTTNETSFFRDQKQLDVFRDSILMPTLDEQKNSGRKSLNIWSAGCSSGEEPYTLSMMLHEILKLGIIGWKIRITANDISSAMIEKAKQGLYNDYSLRNTPKDIIARYFTKEPGGYRIHPKVQKNVNFQKINLNDTAALKTIPRSQIVFCRNVIIYFDLAMKKKVINAFYDNLQPGGYLILGHSESLHSITNIFQPVRKPGGMVYQRME
ncbi:CheR family methyltransferase [Desulfonatronovibrio hydrogenovorans]|uniref:CheR family methyltransferase n=1 Tax=Desulfonatronovibrio hydrogenovorans TaxID=53245 RepID=UPI00048E1725|nr:protein-glutamate O-methyltransferase CheR [Desulfonatronovibrio hydrogenovorans]